jgi:hypothetical protein
MTEVLSISDNILLRTGLPVLYVGLEDLSVDVVVE